MLRAKSLAWRIFFASVILMPILLGFCAFILERAFRASLLTAEKDSLLTHTYSMMAVAEPDDGFLLLPENLTDSRFNDPNSGLYAQVIDDEFGPVWQSISLEISPLNTKIPDNKVEMGNLDLGTARINGEDFFISRFNTVWEIDDQDREYQFCVIHSQKQTNAEIRNYRTTLAIGLIGLALLLILIQAAIIRWGLLPLRRLALDIKQLESGDIENLDDNYPTEILPVTQNINHLLDSESLQRKRYKNTLGDLAHSLKTPLTVIRSILESIKLVPRGAADSPEDLHEGSHASIDEQVERMNNIIMHQLNRATRTKASFQSATPIQPIIERIGQALVKVYKAKNIQFTKDVGKDLEYPAPEDDLMEMLGNLMENAFKYGSSQVYIQASHIDQHLILTIEDDGPGIPENMRSEILERGARVDTSTPGQGIGLAVTTDIVSTYDGGILVKTSHWSGAKFVVTLPY